MHLKFKTPVFNDGINVTVRRGVKWSIAEETEFGHPIVDTNDPYHDDGRDKIIGFAKVVDVRVIRMCDILESMITEEHDPKCRIYHGLLDVMKQTYGSDFDDKEIVTVLTFEFCK